MKYYSVKVKVTMTDDNGKDKKNVELYLVNAVSVTDAETKVHEKFKNDGFNEFEVASVTETKYLEVID